MKIFLLTFGLIIIVGFLIRMNRRRNSQMKEGEIRPADKMKEKYKLSIDPYDPSPLDPEKVPPNLRYLVPLAAKWGIADDVIRGDWQQKASQGEKQELVKALRGRIPKINKWLDAFGEIRLSPEAAAFMYMLLGLDEMGIRIDES